MLSALGREGYFLKSDRVLDVIAAIESLSIMFPFFTGKVTKQMLDIYLAQQEAGKAAPSANTLTRREQEIMQLLVEVRGNKAPSSQIATMMRGQVSGPSSSPLRRIFSIISRVRRS